MAVFTHISESDLQALAGRYNIGRLVRHKGIAEGVQNTNYLLETTTGRYILTIYEERTEVAELPFFLGLMEHLSEGGLHCPTPVHDKSGDSLIKVAGQPAAIVSFLEGAWIRDPGPAHCEAVGEALAQLHLLSQDFVPERKNDLGCAGWRPLFNRFAESADSIQPELRDFIAAELAELEGAWPTALPYGVIHADLFPDNVFFVDGELTGLIDFYFACNDWLAYDLAICLNAWCFERDFSFNADKAAALFRGYQAVRPLTADEIAAFPVLARGAALRFLLTRAHDWLFTPDSAIVNKHDPLDYEKRLRFHQSQLSAGSYGLERV